MKIFIGEQRVYPYNDDMPKIIIFDFDGTIADTHRLSVEIFNSFASQYNYKQIPLDSLHKYKDLNISQIIRKLKIPVLKIPAIFNQSRKKYYESAHLITPFEGMKEVLSALKAQGAILGILSSNAKENIETFLRTHEMTMFDFVYATSRVTSKNSALNKLITQHYWPKDEVVYVGDEIRDIQAAKKIKLAIAAVCWGFNSTKSLKKYKPTYLIQHPIELIKLLEPLPIKRGWLKRMRPNFASKIIAKFKSKRRKQT